MNGEQEPPELQAMAVVHLLPLDIASAAAAKASESQVTAEDLPTAQNLQKTGQASQLQTRVPAQPPLTPTPLLGAHFSPKRPRVQLWSHQTESVPVPSLLLLKLQPQGSALTTALDAGMRGPRHFPGGPAWHSSQLSPTTAVPSRVRRPQSERSRELWSLGGSSWAGGTGPPQALSLLNGVDGLPHFGPELRPRCRETSWAPTSSFMLGVKLVEREVRPVCMGAVGSEVMRPLEFGVMFGAPPPCLDFNITSYLHHGPFTAPGVPRPWRKFLNRL